MADRPILFSAPMVRALLERRKTQTRRLATSKPTQRVAVSDRLWVREAWRTHRVSDELPPRMLTGEGRVWFEADRDNCDQHGRLRPGMFMPRWASRLTLTVTETRTQPLQWIDEADALAEGIERVQMDPGSNHYLDTAGLAFAFPQFAYASVWNALHPKAGERWEDNPDVIAIAFTVEQRNIDG